MKKRVLRIATCVVLAATMLFGACGEAKTNDTTAPQQQTTQGDNTTTNPAVTPVAQTKTLAETANFQVPANGYDGSDVTITFYHTMGANLTTVLDAYIAEFNKLYPNIHVVSEQVGSYDDVRDQISTELTVGNEPNLAYCYPDHVALYNMAKATVQLDALIENKTEVTRADGSKETVGLTDAQKADFIQGYYNEGAAYGDGYMYTLPFSKSTEVLYYNKTFFEEHGISVPTTWDEMKSVCQTIKDIDKESIPLGYDSEGNWFITMCEQYKSPYTSTDAKNHFVFDNAKNREFVKEFRSWYQNGLVTTQTIYGSYTSGLFVAETGIRSYMSIGSSAGATHQRPAKTTDGTYPFEVGIATIPQVDTSNRKVISQGPSVVLFKKSNPQEVVASWLFLKYLTTSVEFQAEFSMTSGYVPVLQSVSENPIYKEFMTNANGGDNVAALAIKVGLDQADAYYVSPAFNGSSVARSQVQSLLAACLSTTGDDDKVIDNAFKNAIEECEYAQ